MKLAAIASLRHQYRRATKVALLVFFLICGFVLVYTLKPASQSEIATLPQDPAVKVYFNQNPASEYEDPYRHFVRKGDNLEKQIVDAIDQAQSTVDVAVMQFRLPKVADALVAKQKAGVKVRLIIDDKYNKALTDYTPEEIARMNEHDKASFEELKRYPADALALLRQNGIEIKDDTSDGATKGSGLMHHKFIVVDGKTTIISSGNLTNSDFHGHFNSAESRGNPNNMIVVSSNTQLSAAFTEEFNYMWQGLFKSHKPDRPPITIPAGAGTITLHFSPAKRKQDIETTSNGMITFFINQVKQSLHIALFVYSDQKISDTVGEVHDRGVEDIKLLVDPDFYGRPYSKIYDAMGVCPSTGRRNSTLVKPWHHPISTVGFPTPSVGDRGVHSKMAILDERLIITGSHNWSSAGNYSNDETLIAVDNPTVAAHYEREFGRLYKTAVVGQESLPHAQKCYTHASTKKRRSLEPEALPVDSVEE